MFKRIRRIVIIILVIVVIPYHYYCINSPAQKILQDELMTFLKNRCYHLSSKDLEQICCKLSDIDFTDNDGNTPLILASKKYNDDAAIKVFLDYGATVNSTNNKEETALATSCKWSRNKNVDLLFRHGADVKRLDKSGQSALCYAAVSLHSTKHSGWVPRSLIGAYSGRIQFEIMKKLIRRGADVNNINEFGETPLIIATRSDEKDLVKLCIENGANLGFKDKNGHTALFYAEKNKMTEIIQLLKE